MPKTHDKAMENLDQKLEAKQEAIKKAEKELKHAKKVETNILFYPTQMLGVRGAFNFYLAKVGILS